MRKAKEVRNPNLVKTSNKLIGDIENRDLYNSDDGGDNLGFTGNQEDLKGQDIELDLGEMKREKKEMGLLFQKINNKK